MATKEAVKNRALIELGAVARGQTLTAAQDADMESAYLGVWHRLADTDAITWGFDEDVPDSVADDVVALVAESRLDYYSVSNDRLQRIKMRAAGADSRIRFVLEPTYQSPQPVSDF